MIPPGNFLVLLTMYGWIPLALYLYMTYPAQRAAIMIFIAAILFLPNSAITLPTIPDYNKATAPCYAILLGAMMYDSGRFSNFQFSLLDVPMVLWCTISPVMSSMTNDLGLPDAFNSMLDRSMAWGAPYYIGRIYLGNLEGLRQLAIGIFAWGLVYVPFCWYESRTFASLHLTVYGLDTGRDAAQSFRYGGYRPQVFMDHGLMLGVWLMTGSIVGLVLWRTGGLKKLWKKPIAPLFGVLLLTFIAARSTGAYSLFLMGTVAIFVAWRFRNAILVWALMLGICYYLYLGASGTFPKKDIVGTLTQIFEADRVASLQFRFDNEEILGDKARQRMLFGWGGFGRNRIYDEEGKDVAVTDSLWIIAFGINGVFGLATMTAAILVPAAAFLVRYPAKLWKNPNVAPGAALAICIVLYMLDCVLNAMVNPIFILAGGGLVGAVLQSKRAAKAEMQRPVQQLASIR